MILPSTECEISSFIGKFINEVPISVSCIQPIEVIPIISFIYSIIERYACNTDILSFVIFGLTLFALVTTIITTFFIPKSILPIKIDVIKTAFLMLIFNIVILWFGEFCIDKLEFCYTYTKLKKYEPVIEQIEEYKSKNGVYPVNIENNIKSFKQFKYKPYYDGSNYVLQVSDSDYWRIEYNYCSNKDDEYCQTGWHNHSVNSKIGKWTKSEEDD